MRTLPLLRKNVT